MKDYLDLQCALREAARKLAIAELAGGEFNRLRAARERLDRAAIALGKAYMKRQSRIKRARAHECQHSDCQCSASQSKD